MGDMLMQGNCPINQFAYCTDVELMNNALHSDPDETGLRVHLASCGVSEDGQDDIYQILAGLLALGNVKFEDVDDYGCRVANTGTLAIVEKLLGLQGMAEALTTATIKIGKKNNCQARIQRRSRL